MKTRKSTMTDLVTELEATLIDTPFMRETIREAKAGEYHDYKNEKYVCGKVALVDRLRYMKLFALADRVIQGEFDEVADEQDKEQMRKELPKEMWPTLGLEPKQ